MEQAVAYVNSGARKRDMLTGPAASMVTEQAQNLPNLSKIW